MRQVPAEALSKDKDFGRTKLLENRSSMKTTSIWQEYNQEGGKRMGYAVP